MKFSDMMGKRGRDTAEVTESEPPPEARTAPPAPEAPIRFGGNRTELDDAVAAFGRGTVTPPPPAPDVVSARPASAAVTPPPPPPPPVVAPERPGGGQPSISDVVAELAPCPTTTATSAATDQQLDASAWLDGIDSIDDDLLPH